MSHSKRNTSRQDFTSYERSLLRSTWGSQSTRLSRDSFLAFGSCRLCLLPARAPVMACATNGDLFCMECAVNNLLAQRQEIRRLEKEWEKEKTEKEEEDLRRESESKDKELKEFEATMAGFGEKRKRDDHNYLNGTSKKRKASDDSQPSTSQSFWVPGLTPSSDTATPIPSKPPKLHAVCPASNIDSPHPYSLKSLVEVHFTEEPTTPPTRVCPSCKKVLSNSSKAVLTKPCGHVLCKSCTDQFMVPNDKPDPHAAPQDSTSKPEGKSPTTVLCYVCETDVTERSVMPTGGGKDKKEKDKGIKPGLVTINCEGTGFAGGGKNMAKKDGVAFQC